jgi:uncharacterized protein YuzE
MKEPSLQVTYRRGRPDVAYLYLPREPGEKSYDTELVEPGMVLDFNKDGRLIGIELIEPEVVTLAAINEVLQNNGFNPLSKADLAPLVAA